jgi:hypothetical protein
MHLVVSATDNLVVKVDNQELLVVSYPVMLLYTEITITNLVFISSKERKKRKAFFYSILFMFSVRQLILMRPELRALSNFCGAVQLQHGRAAGVVLFS